MLANTFSTKEVEKILGLTYRQLDYWDRSGFIKPSVASADGYGSERIYNFQDLVRLKVAKKLKEKGVSLQKLRRSLEYLELNMPEDIDIFCNFVFITDGDSVFILTDNDNLIIDTLRNGQLAFSFNINTIVEDLKIKTTKDKPCKDSKYEAV